MVTSTLIGIMCVIYGLAGVLGLTKAKEEYKDKKWVRLYKSQRGVGMLLVGLGFVVVGTVFGEVTSGVTYYIGVAVAAVPGAIYSALVEAKYSKKNSEEAS